MQSKETPRLLDLKAAAAYSGLTYWSVRDVLLSGGLPFIKRGRRKYFVDRQDLDQWIDRNKERITPG